MSSGLMESLSHAPCGTLVSSVITLSKERHAEGMVTNKVGGELAVRGNPYKFEVSLSFGSASCLMELRCKDATGAMMARDNVERRLAI